jgi:hypothetical protein
MKAAESTVKCVKMFGPDAPEFETHLVEILGRAPRELLRAALPFSVIVENASDRPVALLGVRFDMVGPKAKTYSVVHYADTLRNPEKADLGPGAIRFICAEPAYTSLVLRGEVVANTRGRMNLDNLRRMLQIRATLDCVAFDDGAFHGPDTQGAFGRIMDEREAELALLGEVARLEAEPVAQLEALLFEAVLDPSDRSRRAVARKLIEGLESGGRDELNARVKGYRCRIPLVRKAA